MRRLTRRAIVVVLVLLAAIQLVRPARTNPPVDPDRTLQAGIAPPHAAVAVIARACRDCHSSDTSWPWYSRVAPASWLVAHDVNEGRAAVNFSDWTSYPADQQQKILKEACDEVRQGEMPIGIYLMLHADAKLAPSDIRAVCDLAERTD